jgi:hypothetical protein
VSTPPPGSRSTMAPRRQRTRTRRPISRFERVGILSAPERSRRGRSASGRPHNAQTRDKPGPPSVHVGNADQVEAARPGEELRARIGEVHPARRATHEREAELPFERAGSPGSGHSALSAAEEQSRPANAFYVNNDGRCPPPLTKPPRGAFPDDFAPALPASRGFALPTHRAPATAARRCRRSLLRRRSRSALERPGRAPA